MLPWPFFGHVAEADLIAFDIFIELLVCLYAHGTAKGEIVYCSIRHNVRYLYKRERKKKKPSPSRRTLPRKSRLLLEIVGHNILHTAHIVPGLSDRRLANSP